MSRPSLSVVVVTLNEGERIRACLESVAWADEVIVVDAEAKDKTAAIARELTDHGFVRPWPGFAAQKNFAIDQAHGEWILSLDADEVVSPAPGGEMVRELAALGGHEGYSVPRRNVFWDRWVRHGGLYPDWQLRLFRRGRGRFVARAVHESVVVDGSVGRLRGHLEHRSYRDVADFLQRTDRYTTLAAEDWLAGGRGTRPFADLVVRPLGRFFAMCVWRGGLLGGQGGV